MGALGNAEKSKKVTSARNAPSGDEYQRLERARSKPLNRHLISSDSHGFVGRIYDLSIIGLHFETYEELAQHADCKYALDANYALSNLTRRVETLNLVGDLLWPRAMPENFRDFPISRYQWLTVSADVFLMRYVSVVDCAMLLVNTIYEAGLDTKDCTLRNLMKHVPAQITAILRDMHDEQGSLRAERNARIHHGEERGFTQDDQTFRLASLFEHRTGDARGFDRFGRKINLERSFQEGLVELQRDFNRTTRRLVRQLDRLYDELWGEFNSRFSPRYRVATHGLNSSRRRQSGSIGQVEKS